MLGRWQREFETKQSAAFPGNGRLPLAKEDFYRLRDENKRLRMERDILKQALAFFASGSTSGMPLLPSIRALGP
jgi:transposase